MPYNIIQGDGTPATVPDFNSNGRKPADGSAPVALSNEDKTAIDTMILLLTALRDRAPAAGAASEATLAAMLAAAAPPARVLASNIGLAAGAASTAITAMAAGSYIFEAIFTGSDLQLQRLGPDGATWINAGTLASSGSVGVVLAANDTLRLRNNSGAAMSAITARVA